MTQVISPTPGRVVWFNPTPHDGIATLNGQPLAAIVAGVHNDRLVNLAVFDAYGNAQQRSNVHLVQPGDAVPDSAHATWMPFQIGQKEKTEAAVAVADVAIAAAGIAVAVAQDAVTETVDDSVTQSPAADEAAPSSSEPAQG